MKVINVNSGEKINKILYPDNQPHISLIDIYEGDEVKVICSITDSIKLLNLLQVSNSLNHIGAKKKELYIPYLMGARFDRLMQFGDSVDIQVISELINSCNFDKVFLVDPHSDVSEALIKNSHSLTNRLLVLEYDLPNTVLICPDAGAAKKVSKYFEWNSHINDIVYCIKHRDLSNGKLSIKVLEPEKCKDKNCLIIDDICDGGGTFLGIASQIEPAALTLIVTHGIFSQGFSALEKRFLQIITSNSYQQSYSSKIVKTINYIL